MISVKNWVPCDGRRDFDAKLLIYIRLGEPDITMTTANLFQVIADPKRNRTQVHCENRQLVLHRKMRRT